MVPVLHAKPTIISIQHVDHIPVTLLQITLYHSLSSAVTHVHKSQEYKVVQLHVIYLLNP